MAMNATDIQDGMDVYGSDGEKIGSISQVYPGAGSGTGISGTTQGFGTENPGTVGDVVAEEVQVPETAPDYATTDPRTGGYATTGTPAARTAPGTAAMGTMTATGYFKVDQGGILGIGARELYFPFSAVSTVVLGDNVTVNCIKDECTDLYATKPSFLDQDRDNNRLT